MMEHCVKLAVVLILLNFYLISAFSHDENRRVIEFEKEFSNTVGIDQDTSYPINDNGGFAHKFNGIGGLSGGGATSRLLVNYAEPYRSQILDFLFKPNFAASLHILKVEIGGDAQSTEGTEATHMRSENEENYTRGYEWWLMKEAKARNPDITLIGLPWTWPSWIGQGTVLPYENKTLTATYIMKWVKGAKEHHGLAINYVGIWNERPYNVEYIKTLRKVLDENGFSDVGIIASDNSFIPTSESILHDGDLAKAVEVIGAHYPGTYSGTVAQETKKPLWASEDYSTFNDAVGAGCWARILNQNYVNGNITATIAWNLIASYYDDLPYKRCSLLTANEPWSGHYEQVGPLWVTAHTTQFTKPGWYYLKTTGHLSKGGSYAALTDGKGNLTIVIETLSHDQSICIRPPLPSYDVADQNVTLTLGGSFKGVVKVLNMWQSQLGQASTIDSMFVNKGKVTVGSEGEISLFVPTNMLITLSTINTAMKGSYPMPPASAAFPLPYTDTFESNGFSEAYNFADQSGKFETYYNASAMDDHKWTLRQVVTARPVTWCDDPDLGFTVIGDYSWSNVAVSVDVKPEDTYGVFVALRVDKGGCDAREASGLFLWFMTNRSWVLTTDIMRENRLQRCAIGWECWVTEFQEQEWNQVTLEVSKDTNVVAYLNGAKILEHTIKKEDAVPANGFAALGTASFGKAQYDSFTVKPSS
uniref:Galactocerebrosidase n=1 Tax=Phallusia mammillata TaxID=59560 RepID=A0A6F9DDY3_9ASCI|nr:galactocerebrosidase [Phallusia mammillata]